MKNPDGSISVPEEHKVTATQLYLEMDMLDFEFICLKMDMHEAAKARNYARYREIQRKMMPTVEAQHIAARNALWNFLKECIPDIAVSKGSSWDFDPEVVTVRENKPLPRIGRG